MRRGFGGLRRGAERCGGVWRDVERFKGVRRGVEGRGRDGASTHMSCTFKRAWGRPGSVRIIQATSAMPDEI